MAAPAACCITLPKEVAIQVGCRLKRDTGTQAIDEVGTHHRIDGTNIHFTGIACLNIVLCQQFKAQKNIFETTDGTHAIQEIIHSCFAARQFHLTVLSPKVVVHQSSIWVCHRLGLALKELGGDLRKLIIREAGGSDGHTFLKEIEQHQLHDHVVNAEHPFARWQFSKLLRDLQALNKIDICLIRQNQFAALHLIRRVLQHIQVATEAEILLVVGQEMQVDTRVALNEQRVFDIVAVEGDGTIADRRRKGMLEQSHLVVINIDIGKDILRHGIQDIARLEEVVDTR